MTRSGKRSVLVLNGPNLNLLGLREPQLYGSATLGDVEEAAKEQAKGAGAHLEFFQTNWEGAFLERVHAARTDGTDGIVVNAGAWTHYNVSIRDALLGVSIPFVEVHVTNIHAREEWRHTSFLTDKAVAIIAGAGPRGYHYSIDLVLNDEKKFPSRPEPEVER